MQTAKKKSQTQRKNQPMPSTPAPAVPATQTDDALLQEPAAAQQPEAPQVHLLDLNRIVNSPYNPRKEGWDSRPLKEHRTYMRELYEAETRERQRLLHEREEHRRQAKEQEVQEALLRAEKAFRNGDFIPAELFIGLCGKYGVEIHPRTLGALRRRIARLSSTHIQCKNCCTHTPSVNGCSG